MTSVPISLLDLATVESKGGIGDALAHSVDLARAAETGGYRRVWYAEHHNMPSIASSATAVLIAHVAAHTQTIRLGAGGIMLPNHSPLVIAEQFGTLAELHPGRIDLGLGRAPGSDMATFRALRRELSASEAFPSDIVELQQLLGDSLPRAAVNAYPGRGTRVPLYVLGSSMFGASLAAQLGLPYAFASHFAPAAMSEALALYHRDFKPSRRLRAPYAMLALNVVAADTRAEAQRLFTTQQQAFVRLRRGTPGLVPPPVEDIEAFWTPAEKAMVEQALACAVVGDADDVREGIAEFARRHRPDELMLTANIFDHGARLHSFALAARAFGGVVR